MLWELACHGLVQDCNLVSISEKFRPVYPKSSSLGVLPCFSPLLVTCELILLWSFNRLARSHACSVWPLIKHRNLQTAITVKSPARSWSQIFNLLRGNCLMYRHIVGSKKDGPSCLINVCLRILNTPQRDIWNTICLPNLISLMTEQRREHIPD